LRSPPEALAARSRVGAEAVQELGERASACQRSRSSCDLGDAAARGEALAQRRRGRQHGLLLDQRDGKPVAPANVALVERAVPAITARSEDLPVPLRPMRPMRSFSSTVRAAPSSRGWVPYASPASARVRSGMGRSYLLLRSSRPFPCQKKGSSPNSGEGGANS
jgi:hypothetical protein